MSKISKLGKRPATKNDEADDYLETLYNAEFARAPFPVEFDSVWPIAYATRVRAKKSSIGSGLFREGEDYQIHREPPSSLHPRGARRSNEVILLSIQCAEFFIARKCRQVFEVYRHCRQLASVNL